MTSKVMYFGTRERMTWVKAPAFNPDISKVGWSATNLFLNGGASVRRSTVSHKEYQFAWNLASAEDIAAISDYADGLYGDDLIYFLDPFAMTTNLLPQMWATPRLGVSDGIDFANGARRPTLITTPTNSLGYPTKSAVYTFNSSSVFESVYIPIPPGYALNFGANGSATGTAAVVVADANLPTVSTVRTNYAKDPSFENTVANLAASNGTLTQATGTAKSGTKFARLIANSTSAMSVDGTGSSFAVVAGESFAFSSWVRGTVGKLVQIRATWTGASATTSTLTALASASAWQQISLTGTVPTGATSVRVDVRMDISGGIVSGITTLDVDDQLFERGTATIGTNFTGSTAAGSVANVRTSNAWVGTVGGSTSTQVVRTAPGTAVTLLSETSTVRTNYTLANVAGVYITFWGSGTLTLSGMIAQVRPIGEAVPYGPFISGRGHSGCRFSSGPAIQGYSAPQALDYQAMTATLTETGSWE